MKLKLMLECAQLKISDVNHALEGISAGVDLALKF
jgi:hypothetical protein